MTGSELRALRITLGWRPAALAQVLGVSVRQYYRYEAAGPGAIHKHTAALIVLIASSVMQARRARESRVLAWCAAAGHPADLAGALLAVGLEHAEAGIPLAFCPEALAPAAVALPVDVSDLVLAGRTPADER